MNPYKHLLLIVISIVSLSACQSNKNDIFSFNPVLNKNYQFSLIKTTQEWTNNNQDRSIFDTSYIDFTLRNIKSSDSSCTCKLIFNGYKLIRHPFKITFVNTNKPVKIPYIFGVLDSLGHYLQNIPLFIEFKKNGIVENVNGVDELEAKVSASSHTEGSMVKRLLSDYISPNAIKDLFNRFFSIPQNRKVMNGDRLVTNIILVTKAPIKISNDYFFRSRNGDSLNVEIASILSSVHDAGEPVYLTGKQNGYSVISYSSGMPYSYETNSETVTKTSYYDVVQREHFILKQFYTSR